MHIMSDILKPAHAAWEVHVIQVRVMRYAQHYSVFTASWLHKAK